MSPSLLDLKSPSVMSMAGGSIWEDASVAGSLSPTSARNKNNESVEGKGNRKRSADEEMGLWDEQGRVISAKSPFVTPKGKGLGLALGMGTPGSLYDGEGFLRE
jgi:hypothetical protein